MKVVVNCYEICGKKFVVIKDHSDKPGYETYYGTIPYSEITEDGKMKRALNGFEICIETTLGAALDRRSKQVEFENWMKEHPMTSEAEKIQFISSII